MALDIEIPQPQPIQPQPNIDNNLLCDEDDILMD